MAARGNPTGGDMIVSGKFRLLHEYLDGRFANTVVLTFGQIEELLGFELPDLARTDPEWWTSTAEATPGPRCSAAWVLASRTAKPHLSAEIVVFERVS